MSYPLSDEESSDSDTGVRFKTTNIRNKFKSNSSSSFHTLEYCNDRLNRKKYRSPDRNSHEENYKRRDKYEKERKKEKQNRKHKRDSKDIECLERRTDRTENKTNRTDRDDFTRTKYSGRDSRKHERKSNKEKNNLSPTLSQNTDKKLKTNEDVFGPALPTKLNKIESDLQPDSSDNNSYGPELPSSSTSHKKPEKVQLESEKQKNDSNSDSDCFGPSLPPKTKESSNTTRSKIIGPALPDHVVLQTNEITNEIKISDSEEDEDMNIIGPLPPNVINTKLEERALEIKLNSYNKNVDIKTREEWMLELPEVHSVAKTLGPRTFRAKEMPDMSDRSSWTEINGQKSAKPSTTKVDLNAKYIEEKNAVQEKIVEKHKKNKRCKSLVDMHNEEMQRKKAKEKSNERRPFSRDVDLQVNRFDAEHSKSVIKKAHLLDSRFSSGQSKFL